MLPIQISENQCQESKFLVVPFMISIKIALKNQRIKTNKTIYAKL